MSASAKRLRVGPRTQVACVACKARKQKCDPVGATCRNCLRAGRECIIEDPATKRHQPRNYLRSLEERVAMLEGLLRDVRPDVILDPQQTSHQESASSDSGLDLLRDLEPTSSPLHAGTEASDDLSSKIGLLCLNAAGQSSHYLGASSGFSFSRVVSSSLRQIRSQGPGFTMGGARDTMLFEVPLPDPAPLPSRQFGKVLSNAYFDNIQPQAIQYPIFHRPTFEAWEEEVMDARDNAVVTSYVASFFVNMVYAVGTLILPCPICSPPECFYAAAQEHMDAVIQLGGLEGVQAILSCAMYSLRGSIGVSVWFTRSLSGLALRQCVELGYHRNPQRFKAKPNHLQMEMQRRVFWMAYNLDRCAAITLGRPFGIADKDIDVDLPLDIDDEMITATCLITVPRSLPESPPTVMSAAIHTTHLRRIWSRIQDQIYSVNTPINMHHYTDELLPSFKKELDGWLECVPSTRPPSSGVLSTFSTAEWFQLAYNHSILLLYRRALVNDRQGKSTANYMECCQAARDICLLYRKLFLNSPVSYTWGVLHILFLAGLTYLHCVITSPGVREAVRQDEVSSTCTACTIVLVIMAERWKAAAPYRDTFEMLANATMSMLVRASTSTAASTPNQCGYGPILVPGDVSSQLEEMVDIGMCSGTEELLNQFLGV
ncbi:hypothetical protein ASPZODRAFT_58113 [Penicilliopsis zonata CBS 506.65]|uniref:Zn(2)-C6 fungal-type domain-containing protein n=1 Tax=Penicilliopsis zonata CBS 506.65 TaxID=1073090 RepID=A0A1L9ST16_9EURO|nr:hypothetical protein ASPZODRAFT_58113 [Penicilliopsis zonata CBS 506.65]OJJ50349.1 hypothetical protein ASPZODRAFT_58113 [Penicilliopsis zonata CBS 506.65]